MEAIHFEADVGSDNTIRAPEGVTLPPGPAVITVVPMADNSSNSANTGFPKRESYATIWDWLYAVGRHAETLRAELPTDMAENHDFYAHGKRE